MNDTVGEPEGTETRSDAIPNVTQIPLSAMASQTESVLATAIRRLVDDVTSGREVTAQFGSAP